MDTSELSVAREARDLPVGRCPRCEGALDLRTPHVVIEGQGVRAYCSRACALAGDAPPLAPPRRRRAFSRLVRVVLGVPMLGLMSWPLDVATDAPSPRIPEPTEAAHAPIEAGPPVYGPAWPPSEEDWAKEIAADVWVHPLDGPLRRMPVSDSRVFGAERPGDRPGECEHGHCGVDLSGPWGEPVHAVHAGVVERVQRGQNDEHGGQYVRLLHRDGTVITQYFHLAAIPRRLVPGALVKAGEVIGLLGDTGVKHSDPHLHFTISVMPSPRVPERYIDPEPLIALWPLRIAIGETSGLVSAQEAPGVPFAASHVRKKQKARVLAESTPATATE